MRTGTSRSLLTAIAQHVQTQVTDAKVAIHRFEDDGETLRLEGAAGLPPPLAAALEGIEVGPDDAECRPSFCSGETVIATDIESDERWPWLRRVAASHGLRACWSMPVLPTDQGTVLGSITLYWQDPREPSPSEKGVMDEAVSLAAVAFERHRIVEELAFRATHDSLTSLPNRTLLDDRIVQVLARRRRGELGSVSVLFLDLDRFKDVNDRFGHAAGDALLVDVAARLQTIVREVDTVARFGGDEFIVVGVAEDPASLARRINQAVAQPFVLDGQRLKVSCSIGISTADPESGDPESLIREADLALY